MDTFLRKQLNINTLRFQNSLEQIIEKYSKLQHQDDCIDVDIMNIKHNTLERYMRQSKAELNKLDSENMADLREESIMAQDVTRDSQLDFTYQNGGADETCGSATSEDDDGMCTDMTVSSLDESNKSNVFETAAQPEDQDEELEMSLRSRGSSLVELYPSLISRIGRAWHRQHVSEAADSVLRRYRRWRQQSNRSNLNNTFTVMVRHANKKPQNMTSHMLLEEEKTNSPVKRPFTGTGATSRSPFKMVTSMQGWQEHQQSPKRMVREQHRPVLVMDFSGPSMPKESSLNETFTVCEVSQLGEHSSMYKFSPSRPYYPATKASADPSCRPKRLSLTAHTLQTDGCSMYASEAVKERPDIYGSPVRQRPVQASMMTSLSRSPHGLSRSPKVHSFESFSREPTRARFMSTPPQKPAVTLGTLYPRDSHHFPRSPQPTRSEERRHRLQRHKSLDSSLPSSCIIYSPKKLDEDFLKVYHKFVCQNKSSLFNRQPCRLCARSSDARRGPPSSSSSSSSALAALNLSPHRSLLSKRHRELDWDGQPQSKRCRANYCLSSPGSTRHGHEMLRRRLSVAGYEQSQEDLSYSAHKPGMFQRFSTQQRSTDAHQEAWMSRRHHVSGAGFSGMGRSLESRMASGSSPRKW